MKRSKNLPDKQQAGQGLIDFFDFRLKVLINSYSLLNFDAFRPFRHKNLYIWVLIWSKKFISKIKNNTKLC
jgi:hypothetical protein